MSPCDANIFCTEFGSLLRMEISKVLPDLDEPLPLGYTSNRFLVAYNLCIQISGSLYNSDGFVE